MLEGASTAASVPSILGYIAIATAGNELLRGKAAARFEGATLAGLGCRLRVAPLLFEAIGPTAFFLNAAGLRRLVPDLPARRQGSGRRARGASSGAARRASARYVELLRTVARLAAGADLDRGQRLDRPVVQPVALPVLARRTRDFPDQVLMRGFSADPDLGRRRSSSAIVFGAGPALLGQPVQEPAPDDDHPVRDPRRRRARRGRAGRQPLGRPAARRADRRRPSSPAFGLFVLAGATPAALGLLADISERFPPTAARSWASTRSSSPSARSSAASIGGFAADWRGHRRHADRHVRAAARRARSRWPSCATPGAPRRRPGADRAAPSTTRRPADDATRPAAGRRSRWRAGAHGAVVAPHHLATAAGLGDPAAGRLRGGRGDRDQRGARRRHCPAAAASAATRSG